VVTVVALATLAQVERAAAAPCSQPPSTVAYEVDLDVAASNPNDYPELDSTVRAVLPKEWDIAQTLASLPPADQGFQDALNCVFGDWFSEDATSHVSRNIRQERLSLTVNDSSRLFDSSFPSTVGPWEIDPTDGDFAISLIESAFEVSKASWHLTVTLTGLRLRSTTPFPMRAGSGRIEWTLENSEALSEVKAIAKPSFRMRLFLGSRSTSVRWVRQLSWWTTRLIVPLMLVLLLLWRRWRSALLMEERRALLGVLVALSLAGLIFLFSPGFYSRGSPLLTLLLVSAGLHVGARTRLLRRLDLRPLLIATLLTGVAVVGVYFSEIAPWVSDLFASRPGESTRRVLDSVELMVRGLSAAIVTYFVLTGLVWLAAASWPNISSAKSLTTKGLFYLTVVALAIATAAESAWAITSELGGQDRPSTWDLGVIAQTDWFDNLSRRVEGYPVDLLYQLMVMLPLVALIAAGLILRARRSAQTPKSVFLPSGAEASIVALLFAGFVVRPWGFVLGFWVPVAFFVAFLLLRLVVRHPRLKQREELIRAANPTLPEGAPSPLITHRQELLRRSLAVELIEGRERKLYDRAFAEGMCQSDYESKHEELVAEGATQRTGVSLEVGNGQALQLPAEVKLAPNQLALASGPGQTWWDSGRIAVEKGWILALIPVAIYGIELYNRRGSPPLSWSAPFAPLSFVSSITLEFAVWITLAFVFGCLYAHLPGSNGLVKGATLAATFLVANTVGVQVAHWIGGAPASAVMFRTAQLLLFLIVLGVLLDRETIRIAGHHWRELLAHYQLRKNRGLVTYLAPLAIAIITIGQLLATGDLGKALSEIVKNVPQAIPH
jgi:hypothetical protein